MKFITHTLAILGVAVAGALCVTSAAHAVDFGPPQQAPVVASCSLVTVDPPEPVNVYLHGTIGGQTVELTVEAAQVNGHEAEFDISSFTTFIDTDNTGNRQFDYELWATWSLGTGDSPHNTGSVICPPTETSSTTTSTSTTTVAPTTTTLVPEHQCTTPQGAHYGYSGPNPPCGLATTTTTTVTPQIGTPLTAVRTAAPASLPNTGSDNGPVVELAACFILAGSVMIWKARRS